MKRKSNWKAKMTTPRGSEDAKASDIWQGRHRERNLAELIRRAGVPPRVMRGETVLTEWCRGWGLPPPAELLGLDGGVVPRRIEWGLAGWYWLADHTLGDLVNCRDVDMTPACGLVGSAATLGFRDGWVGINGCGSCGWVSSFEIGD